jgi:hypothetical protein
MPQTNKIERYELQTRVMELSIGRSTHAVSEILTEELRAKGLDDQISQPTVARFLKAIREARAEETKNQVQEHIKEHVPADLNALEEIETWLLNRFRGRVDLTDFITEKVGLTIPKDKLLSVPQIRELAQEMAAIIDGDQKTRAEFGMKAARLIELKLKYAGILENPEAGGSGKHVDPMDLDEYSKEIEQERGKVLPH